MIREIIGETSIQFIVEDQISLEKMISQLVREYPDLQPILFNNNKLNPQFLYIVNGEEMNLGQNKVIHTDETNLVIIPPAGGG